MPNQRIASEIREQILHRIRAEGISATQAAREHGVSVKSVYYWLRKKVEMPSNILQINKLKRENEELQRLLGKAMVEIERSKKNSTRYGI